MKKHLLFFPSQINLFFPSYPFLLMCKKTTHNRNIVTNLPNKTTCKLCK